VASLGGPLDTRKFKCSRFKFQASMKDQKQFSLFGAKPKPDDVISTPSTSHRAIDTHHELLKNPWRLIFIGSCFSYPCYQLMRRLQIIYRNDSRVTGSSYNVTARSTANQSHRKPNVRASSRRLVASSQCHAGIFPCTDTFIQGWYSILDFG
jgi:hypothetical protein